jgi:hypothetical protein
MIRYKVALIKTYTNVAVWITVMGNNKRMAYEKAVQICHQGYIPIYDSIEELSEEEDFQPINQAC